MSGPHGKICENCIHYRYYAKSIDKDLYIIPASWECINTAVDHTLFDKLTIPIYQLPFHCGQYKSKIIDRCFHCDKPINEPEYCWPIWSIEFIDTVPLCSIECVNQVAEIDEKRLEGPIIDDEEYYGP